MVVLMGLILSFGAFVPAFGQKNDNRPPKQPEKVKEPDKQPRANTNKPGQQQSPRPAVDLLLTMNVETRLLPGFAFWGGNYETKKID
jgi:hypothetical protein